MKTTPAPLKRLICLAALLPAAGLLPARSACAEEAADRPASPAPAAKPAPKDEAAAKKEQERLEETRKQLKDSVGEKGKADIRDGELKLDITKEDWDKLTRKQRDALAKKLQKVWKGSGRKVKLPKYMEGPTQGSGRTREGGGDGAEPPKEAAAVESVQQRLPSDLRDSPSAMRFFDGSPLSKAARLSGAPMSIGSPGGSRSLPVLAADPRLGGPALGPAYSRAQLPAGFRSLSEEPPAPASRYEGAIQAAVNDKGLGLKHVDAATLRALLGAKNPSWLKGQPSDGALAAAERRLVKGGSYGLLLVSPEAARWAGVQGDLRDPATNIRAGAKVLDKLTDIFGGDIHKGLAAYQAGLSAVRRSGGIPQREDVRGLMADYERALRAPSPQTPVKPPVQPVDPPSPSPAKQAAGKLAEALKAAVEGTPDIGDDRPKYVIKSKVDRWMDQDHDAAVKAGVDPRISQGAMYAEMGHLGAPSYCNPWGACGLMQIKQDTMMGMVRQGYLPKPVNIRTADGNLQAGNAYLKYLLDTSGGDKVLALAKYNSGDGYGAYARGRIPDIPETARYVARVSYWIYANYGERLPYEQRMSAAAGRWAAAEWNRMASIYGYR